MAPERAGPTGSGPADGPPADGAAPAGEPLPGGAAPASPEGHWFEALADHMGGAYLRYSFTQGTEQEVAFLVEVLGLGPGSRVLDVGCGPGRHARALAERGIQVVGVDISQRFVDVAAQGAPPGATFLRADARALRFDAEFDAAISLCQGAFGLGVGPVAPTDHAAAEPTDPVEPTDSAEPADPAAVTDRVAVAERAAVDDPQGLAPDRAVLDGIRRALVPGGRAAVSAFCSYFQVRWLEGTDSFDAERGLNHERTEVRSESGAAMSADLWTTCFTPRELRLLAESAGLGVDDLWSVTPGDYARRRPDLDHPELLLVAHRPW